MEEVKEEEMEEMVMEDMATPPSKAKAVAEYWEAQQAMLASWASAFPSGMPPPPVPTPPMAAAPSASSAPVFPSGIPAPPVPPPMAAGAPAAPKAAAAPKAVSHRQAYFNRHGATKPRGGVNKSWYNKHYYRPPPRG